MHKMYVNTNTKNEWDWLSPEVVIDKDGYPVLPDGVIEVPQGHAFRKAPPTGKMFDWDTSPGELPVLVNIPTVTDPVTYSSRDFMKLFTSAEKTAIYADAATDNLTRMVLDDLIAADFIDIADADTIAGMDHLKTKTLITQTRYDVMLQLT